MVILFQKAELPLSNALQVAVAVHAVESCSGTEHPNSSLYTLNSFDGRTSGYDLKDATEILCAMRANHGIGRELYLWRHFPIDTLFAVTYSISFASIWLYLLRQYQASGGFLSYLFVIPLLGGLFDIGENFAVRSLVEGKIPPELSSVGMASFFTVTKFYLVGGSGLIIIFLLGWFLGVGALRKA